MSGPRVRSWYDSGASEFIVKWLLDYAEGHLHDPSKESTIILYVSTEHKCMSSISASSRKEDAVNFSLWSRVGIMLSGFSPH